MRDQKTEALRLISEGGCENLTSGWCGEEGEERTPYAKYTSERWCNPCIARAGMEGCLPLPLICIEAEAYAGG